jgi:hypothetical protein
MSQEITKKQLLENWIEASERLIACIAEDQLEAVPALLDVREKILIKHQLSQKSGDITAELCIKADRVEKEVYHKMNSKVEELRQLLQATSRQKRLNSYEKYEENDMNSILNFYK